MATRKTKCRKPAAALVVVAIRDFMNGEHHWIAPDAECGDPEAFGSTGRDEYYKPVFRSLKDAEDWAASLATGEWELDEFERGRPKFLVVEDSALVETIERDSYLYPVDADWWSDAELADFERRVDCEFLLSKALWDSDSDKESGLARELGYAAELERPARRRRGKGASK